MKNVLRFLIMAGAGMFVVFTILKGSSSGIQGNLLSTSLNTTTSFFQWIFGFQAISPILPQDTILPGTQCVTDFGSCSGQLPCCNSDFYCTTFQENPRCEPKCEVVNDTNYSFCCSDENFPGRSSLCCAYNPTYSLCPSQGTNVACLTTREFSIDDEGRPYCIDYCEVTTSSECVAIPPEEKSAIPYNSLDECEINRHRPLGGSFYCGLQ